ncbi:MAG TPA: glucose 1-dehydrogenase [Vicinamibacterales bacterium]|nr:glucose 1-dehydrogenase [Vicinamibacterales bacterium]
MKAIVVRPGEPDSIHMRDMPDPVMRPGEVAVRTLRVGLCATDAEINEGLFGHPPAGEEFLILGHENLGVVEDVGRKVTGWKRGDVVVSSVRRPCGVCPNCRAGENDMCSSGRYTERGIMRRHGFMAEYYVESPGFLFRIPRSIRDVAVLLEPMSIVEKGIDHAWRLQRRLLWKPRFAMVLGAGPIGLLAAAVLRARGLRTVVVAREAPEDSRARLAGQLGAEYVSVADVPLLTLTQTIGRPDLIIEATGSARVVFAAMEMLALNGVLCLLSVTSGRGVAEEPIERINQQLVLGNRVVFGSVNANLRHFAMGVKDFVAIEKKRPGVLGRLITTRLPWTDHQQWFSKRTTGIKTVLDITDRGLPITG